LESPVPNEFERALGAAIARHQRGDVTGAIAGYERLLADHPDEPRVLANLAAALKHAGRIEDALARLQRALQRLDLGVEVRAAC